jgi:hypothetical protein
MAYAPLDAKFDDHPKYIDYGAAEMGLIACGITYANRNMTDGVLPRSWPVRRFGPEAQSAVERLIAENVWARRPDGSLEIVGFLDHNRSRAEILELRQAKVEAGKRGGHRSWESRANGISEAPASALASALASAPAKANGQAVAKANGQHLLQHLPKQKKKSAEPSLLNPTTTTDPTVAPTVAPTAEPEPPTASVGAALRAAVAPAAPAAPAPSNRKKPKLPLPPDWKPSAETLAKYAAKGIDAMGSLERFANHQIGKDNRAAEWDRAFRNWVDEDIDDGKAKKLPDPGFIPPKPPPGGWVGPTEEQKAEMLRSFSAVKKNDLFADLVPQPKEPK